MIILGPTDTTNRFQAAIRFQAGALKAFWARRILVAGLMLASAGLMLSAQAQAQVQAQVQAQAAPAGLAQVGLAQAGLAQAFATQIAFIACFEPALALRIGEEVSDGKVRHWVQERFETGECLALPAGTEITRTNQGVVSGRHVQKFQLVGSTLWLTRPDWAMTLTATKTGAGASKTQAAFEDMVPVTKALMDYATAHLGCVREVLTLNKRVKAHNLAVVEERREREKGKEAVSRTVIVLNPTELDRRGGQLNREVEDFKARCTAFSILEAATPFVRMMRQMNGMDENPQRRKAA